MWGSLLSFSEGRYFTKRPRRMRRPVTLTYGLPLPVGQWSQRCWPWDRLLQRCFTAEASTRLVDALGGRARLQQRFPTEACTAARSRSLEPYFEARFGRGPDGRPRVAVPMRHALELFCSDQMRVRLLGR